ncbi:MAG: hypothetical protein EP298_12220 [Gammaproteobacteria bacterium]|nr:MAG: hypothetical protein EP298_12220 [Gammaproteobacteria bacterium]UTW43060.1 hypothetical protein KFE69_02645 [bacterium SCSIO 12844]
MIEKVLDIVKRPKGEFGILQDRKDIEEILNPPKVKKKKKKEESISLSSSPESEMSVISDRVSSSSEKRNGKKKASPIHFDESGVGTPDRKSVSSALAKRIQKEAIKVSLEEFIQFEMTLRVMFPEKIHELPENFFISIIEETYPESANEAFIHFDYPVTQLAVLQSLNIQYNFIDPQLMVHTLSELAPPKESPHSEFEEKKKALIDLDEEITLAQSQLYNAHVIKNAQIKLLEDFATNYYSGGNSGIPGENFKGHNNLAQINKVFGEIFDREGNELKLRDDIKKNFDFNEIVSSIIANCQRERSVFTRFFGNEQYGLVVESLRECIKSQQNSVQYSAGNVSLRNDTTLPAQPKQEGYINSDSIRQLELTLGEKISEKEQLLEDSKALAGNAIEKVGFSAIEACQQKIQAEKEAENRFNQVLADINRLIEESSATAKNMYKNYQNIQSLYEKVKENPGYVIQVEDEIVNNAAQCESSMKELNSRIETAKELLVNLREEAMQAGTQKAKLELEKAERLLLTELNLLLLRQDSLDFIGQASTDVSQESDNIQKILKLRDISLKEVKADQVDINIILSQIVEKESIEDKEALIQKAEELLKQVEEKKNSAVELANQVKNVENFTYTEESDSEDQAKKLEGEISNLYQSMNSDLIAAKKSLVELKEKAKQSQESSKKEISIDSPNLSMRELPKMDKVEFVSDLLSRIKEMPSYGHILALHKTIMKGLEQPESRSQDERLGAETLSQVRQHSDYVRANLPKIEQHMVDAIAYHLFIQDRGNAQQQLIIDNPWLEKHQEQLLTRVIDLQVNKVLKETVPAKADKESRVPTINSLARQFDHINDYRVLLELHNKIMKTQALHYLYEPEGMGTDFTKKRTDTLSTPCSKTWFNSFEKPLVDRLAVLLEQDGIKDKKEVEKIIQANPFLDDSDHKKVLLPKVEYREKKESHKSSRVSIESTSSTPSVGLSLSSSSASPKRDTDQLIDSIFDHAITESRSRLSKSESARDAQLNALEKYVEQQNDNSNLLQLHDDIMHSDKYAYLYRPKGLTGVSTDRTYKKDDITFTLCSESWAKLEEKMALKIANILLQQKASNDTVNHICKENPFLNPYKESIKANLKVKASSSQASFSAHAQSSSVSLSQQASVSHRTLSTRSQPAQSQAAMHQSQPVSIFSSSSASSTSSFSNSSSSVRSQNAQANPIASSSVSEVPVQRGDQWIRNIIGSTQTGYNTFMHVGSGARVANINALKAFVGKQTDPQVILNLYDDIKQSDYFDYLYKPEGFSLPGARSEEWGKLKEKMVGCVFDIWRKSKSFNSEQSQHPLLNQSKYQRTLGVLESNAANSMPPNPFSSQPDMFMESKKTFGLDGKL